MNINQTRQVLSYLWSTHPNASRMTDEDKARMVACYFRILYKYSLEDVLDGVDRACRKCPAFVPSAYEIEGACIKNPDVYKFLPPEYYELDAQYTEYEGESYYELTCARDELSVAKTESERVSRKRRVDGIIARMEIEEKMHILYDNAFIKALEDYDRKELAMSKEDLDNIGVLSVKQLSMEINDGIQ